MTEPAISSHELSGSTSARMGILVGAEADPSDYLNKLAKHPRLSRMHGYPDGVNGDFLYRSKQPRPLEDGNWMCEDMGCRNVNYPRRSECNKCGKKRGLAGDTIVKNYVESIKMARGETSPSTLQQASRMGAMSNYERGPYYPDGVLAPDLRYSEHDAWMAANGGALDAPYTPHFATNGGLPSRRSAAFTTASEGRRLAEQLLAQFATSADPVADAQECVETARLWLKSLKSRSQADYSHSVSPSSLSPVSSSSLNNLAALSQSDHSSPLVLPSAYYGGSNGLTPGLGLNAHVSTLRAAARVPSTRPVVSYEDYKDRPSDYLREFGDPAALNAAGTSAIRPLAGVNGNWECDDCKNVNFPRRTNCYQCHKKRGPKGEDIVREYVRRLIEESLRV